VVKGEVYGARRRTQERFEDWDALLSQGESVEQIMRTLGVGYHFGDTASRHGRYDIAQPIWRLRNARRRRAGYRTPAGKQV